MFTRHPWRSEQSETTLKRRLMLPYDITIDGNKVIIINI